MQCHCNSAVILHSVSEPVKAGDRRAARRAETEDRLLQAAAELFVTRGYVATSLSQIAAAAGLSDRTVYVRFGTKAALLARAIGVALVGDTQPIPVAERDWVQAAMTAPTAIERITRYAHGARGLFERAGALLAVAAQAEHLEPTIADAAQAGRLETYSQHEGFWSAMRDDGLLAPDADLQWLARTSTVLGSADTYVQTVKLFGWDPDTYEAWLRESWLRLIDGSGYRVSGCGAVD